MEASILAKLSFMPVLLLFNIAKSMENKGKLSSPARLQSASPLYMLGI
jgi:hypothetical protein